MHACRALHWGYALALVLCLLRMVGLRYLINLALEAEHHDERQQAHTEGQASRPRAGSRTQSKAVVGHSRRPRTHDGCTLMGAAHVLNRIPDYDPDVIAGNSARLGYKHSSQLAVSGSLWEREAERDERSRFDVHSDRWNETVFPVWRDRLNREIHSGASTAEEALEAGRGPELLPYMATRGVIRAGLWFGPDVSDDFDGSYVHTGFECGAI